MNNELDDSDTLGVALSALLVLVIIVLFSGCSTASIMKQLKDDHATVRLRVTGWGTVIELDRSNPQQTNAVPKLP